jgi:hypothetical protein
VEVNPALALFIDGPLDGEMLTIPRGMPEFRAYDHASDRYSIVSRYPQPIFPLPRIVRYRPVVLGGFLWYTQEAHEHFARTETIGDE